MWQSILATSSGPWGRIIGVELAIVGVCKFDTSSFFPWDVSVPV
jgi:hypothetical protein